MGGRGRGTRAGPPVVWQPGDDALVERPMAKRGVCQLLRVPRRGARDARMVDDGPVRVGQDTAGIAARRPVHLAPDQHQRPRPRRD